MRGNDRIVMKREDNLAALRERHPAGLTFVVGDTHGAVETLKLLLAKICFDPCRDSMFFLGDYNAGGNVRSLMHFISRYYAEDYAAPGFHLIRGNHERELDPYYSLENLPDIIVLRRSSGSYFLAHAGMVEPAFSLICEDMQKQPGRNYHAYRLTYDVTDEESLLRDIIWSHFGLYSGESRWPCKEDLVKKRALILHGHTPYCYLKKGNAFSYGAEPLYLRNQHIWFSEDLQSFDLDANIKGVTHNGSRYRGLTCLCLEALDEIRAGQEGPLTTAAIKAGQNFAFSRDHVPTYGMPPERGDITPVVTADPEMKTIDLNVNGEICIL